MNDQDFTKVKFILKLLGGLVPEEAIVKVLKRAGIGPGTGAAPAMDGRSCMDSAADARLKARFPHVAAI